MPMAWRGSVRPLTGPDLLAVIACGAFVAGVTLVLVAADASLPTDIPLWDAAFVVCMLAVIGSVIRFPTWWTPPGARRTSRLVCAGARSRRASYTVDVRRARAPHARPRPDRAGTHVTARPVTGAPIDSVACRSHAEWLLAARRRDGMPRLQRQHGRSRG
jgi:hypothetical protein